MPWPKYLKDKAALLREAPEQRLPSALYELYHAILLELFSEDRYDVFPRFTAPDHLGVTREFASPRQRPMIDFVVQAFDGSPVLLLEIKSPTRLSDAEAMRHAEADVLRDFRSLEHLLSVPKLYGISALEKHIACFEYRADSRQIMPARVEISDLSVSGARWEVDIMEDDGYETMCGIVEEIEWMVQGLK